MVVLQHKNVHHTSVENVPIIDTSVESFLFGSHDVEAVNDTLLIGQVI